VLRWDRHRHGGDSDLTAEDPLVEGNRLLGVAGEEQVGVELDRYDARPFQERWADFRI
jgi:hypothetical protein